MRSEAERKLRAGRIGSTDISAILGLHPHRQPIDVWRALVEGHEPEPSEQMALGDHLEPFILEAYARKAKRSIARAGLLLHPSLPTCSTADAVSEGDDLGDDAVRAVEAKSVVGWMAHEYGADGTDEVPQQHVIQAQWHMIHLRASGTQVSRCDLPVLVGGCMPIRIYAVEFDEGLASNLLRGAKDWHDKYVATKTPPPVDGSPAYTQFLADHWTQRAPLRQATIEEIEAANGLRRALRGLGGVEQIANDFRNRLRAAIGEAAGIEGPGFKITWKARKDGKRVFLPKFENEEDDNGNG